MDVSILITVKNDLENMRLLTASLKSLDADFEVVVVDAFSTDGTFEHLQKENEAGRFVIARKKGNRAIGRNECIKLSAGRRLVFLDSDSEISENWMSEVKKNHDRNIVAGKIAQASNSGWADLDRVPMYYDGRDVTYPSNNLVYSRNVIEEIGLFDERFNTAEDIDLNIRAIKAGYDIFYDENLVIYHHPRVSFASLLRQSYQDGIGRKLIKKKYGLKSSFNTANIRKHPAIEISRLLFGMMGYVFGGWS